MQALVRTYFPPLWLGAFLYVALIGNSLFPPRHLYLFLIAGTGLAYHFLFNWDQVSALWRRHSGLMASFVAVALSILASEASVQFYARVPAHGFPPTTGVLLCAPALALFLTDRRLMGWTVFAFACVSFWNLLGMPIEAINGDKITWHAIFQIPREAGPFKFQASGLAIAAFYFGGIMLAAFYLAWGPVFHGRVGADLGLPRKFMLALPMLWLLAAISVQSRSMFAGAVLASVIAVMGGHRRRWQLLGALILVGLAVGIYLALFQENKSGPELRLAYMKLYVERSMEWDWLFWGHGAWLDRSMAVPGLTFLEHSHNDLVQVLWAWGLVTLVGYLSLWWFLLRLVVRDFAAQGEYWPLAALVAVVPSMMTDLGLQHYEKAMFLVVLGGMTMAFSMVPRAAGVPASMRSEEASGDAPPAPSVVTDPADPPAPVLAPAVPRS